MTKGRRPFLAIVAAAFLCGGTAAIAEAQKTIRIGASVSRTGTYAELGPTVCRGQSLCVKQANEAGGVLGRKIELLVEDDRSEADMAARWGLKTIAVLHENTLFPNAVAEGTLGLARTRGLQPVVVEAYRGKTTDFSPILARVKAANPDVVAAATYFDDAVAITRQMKDLDVNSKMYGATIGVDLPKFYEILGRLAEFVYGASQWEPDLVTLRAGGLIPVARQFPGAREFVEAYRKEFPRADLSYQTAQGYTGCQILLEAIKRAGSLDGEKLRDVISKMDLNTVYGAFRVDSDGVQVAHKMVVFQWQDGKKVIVWPDELAPGKARFPTPPWSQRP